MKSTETNFILNNIDIIGSAAPIPLNVYNDLHIRSKVLSYRTELLGRSGIYVFVNLVNDKQYIGSAVNIYRRFLDHIGGRQSNIPLQRAFDKYGKENFQFVVYAYAPYVLPAIIELETFYISYFPFEKLYNLSPAAGSMFGYKHKKEAIEKMKLRLLDPSNHPMFGKTHSNESRSLISKPKSLNPMFGRSHTVETRMIMSNMKGFPVFLYDINNQYILTFKNNFELSKFLGCSKVTVGRYLKSGKLFKGMYYIRSN